MTFNEEARAWLEQLIGQPVRSVQKLKGATSSSVYMVRTGRRPARRFVLRVLDNAEWLKAEPDLAEHEAAALNAASAAGLPAPALVGYARVDVGFGAPAVLMTFLEGSVDLRPSDPQTWLDRLAGQLAAIHRCRVGHFPWRFKSWVDRRRLEPPPWSADRRLWEEAIAMLLGSPPDCPSVFLHRDYHPTNVLWQNGSISGIVDWINACLGPAGADVAHCRTNLALMYGPEVADRFLDRYMRAAGGFTYRPYWDVDGILGGCLPQPGFYRPWREFGLGEIGARELQGRTEQYLRAVMARAG
jgi:aminoglycoside phosphotransferase (APT) family kinase protein